MEEISTSFCFICLLHLANEQGLKLENGAADVTGAEELKKVGDIWDLKVRNVRNELAESRLIFSDQIYRDPHATQSA